MIALSSGTQARAIADAAAELQQERTAARIFNHTHEGQACLQEDEEGSAQETEEAKQTVDDNDPAQSSDILKGLAFTSQVRKDIGTLQPSMAGALRPEPSKAASLSSSDYNDAVWARFFLKSCSRQRGGNVPWFLREVHSVLNTLCISSRSATCEDYQRLERGREPSSAEAGSTKLLEPEGSGKEENRRDLRTPCVR